MSEFIKINETEHVHLSDVKRLRLISQKDLASLARLGEHVDADRFNTRIDHANKTTSYAPETIDQIAAQGVSLVQVDENAFIPRDNINRSRDLTEVDRREFEEKTGRPLRGDFKSQIDTRAGRILSTIDSRTVMRRMSQSFQPNDVDTPVRNSQEPGGVTVANAKLHSNLEQIRSALKEKTSTAISPSPLDQDQSRTPPREPTQ